MLCYLDGFFVSNQAVEGDCDVVLKRVGGALTVTAFKCKTEGKTLTPYSEPFEHRHWHATRVSTYTCLSLMIYRINRGPMHGLSYPPSPKWHHSRGLCPCFSGNLQQQDWERNVHYSGGWKDIITGGPKNNQFNRLPDLMHLHVLFCHNINTCPCLVSGCVRWANLFCRICCSWG